MTSPIEVARLALGERGTSFAFWATRGTAGARVARGLVVRLKGGHADEDL